jgi:hypothetical protein
MVALASTGYSLPKANPLTKSPYAPSIARGTLQLFTAALMPQLGLNQTFAFFVAGQPCPYKKRQNYEQAGDRNYSDKKDGVLSEHARASRD